MSTQYQLLRCNVCWGQAYGDWIRGAPCVRTALIARRAYRVCFAYFPSPATSQNERHFFAVQVLGEDSRKDTCSS